MLYHLNSCKNSISVATLSEMLNLAGPGCLTKRGQGLLWVGGAGHFFMPNGGKGSCGAGHFLVPNDSKGHNAVY